LTLGALGACATPAQRFDDRAAALGFSPIALQGDGFVHRGYSAGLNERSDVLHVYIEHDGTPWTDNRFVADDPTPRTPFALELMGRDTGPRLLLGRPCYFEREVACDPMLWTHRRYSPEVVASMVAALRGFLAQHAYRQVLLIGYSGGGTIAWLMASRSPDIIGVIGVITVAANLDTDAWTKTHGYSAMAGSLNPSLLPQLATATVQVNYFGGRDQNVPPSVVRSFALRHPEAKAIEIPEFDHVCCWIERWPRLLQDSTALLYPAHVSPR
jgi:pimeloyl-ACP methyl ester carboxylesterase